MFIDYNKFHFNKINVLNLLISAIPLSLIIGNLATNINIILICIVGFLIFGKEIFFTNSQENYLLYFFFSYLIIITAFNNLPLLNNNDLYLDHLLKSLFFIRFFILFLIINKLIEKKEFNTNIFFNSCAFFSIIIAVDVTIQFIFKSNILGYPIIDNKPSSFFKSENVAGGYIQKFILFFIFLLSIKKREKINYLNSIIFFSIIFFITIILTGNKMPALLFLISIILFIFFEKKLKQLLITSIILLLVFFSFTKIIISERLHTDLKNFISEAVLIIEKAPKLFLYNKIDDEYSWKTGYLIHFNSGVQQWKQNKIFGAGLKSFRINCTFKKNQTCNTHPHNYFIELLVETGLVGTILIYLVFIIGLKNFLNFYFNEKNISAKLTSIIFFLLIFTEFLPIRSSGSFFTTSNATFIFLILPLFLNIKKIEKLK